ncbi:solute carrier family 35 member G1-like [Stegodyphus dumicola]|uniref:solute carrier family 35 member G1-like n=1 Tax=Stegodyphus dumicola TaxID=202533 RepID=UPI0015AC1010|nr:solute carrier family 35 member G1-like [Stegodyphus dumicola]
MLRKKTYYIANVRQVATLSRESITSDKLSTRDHKENKNENGCKINYKPFLGFFYILMSSIFITLSSVCVKKVYYISPGELSLIRKIGVLFGNIPIAVYYKKNVLGPKGLRLSLTIRAILGATALYLNLMSSRYLPLAEAAIILSTMPAVVGITARLYLKEPCGIIQTFAIVLTVCGVILSIQLPDLMKKRDGVLFDTNYIIGLASGVGGVICLAATFVLVRRLREIHFSVDLIFFSFVGIFEIAIITGALSFYSLPRCGHDPLLIMMIAIFGFLGQCGLILAIQTEIVSIISVMKSALDIVIGIACDVIFFNTIPSLYTVGGGLIVIACIILISTRKWIQEMPEDARLRKKLKYLLL